MLIETKVALWKKHNLFRNYCLSFFMEYFFVNYRRKTFSGHAYHLIPLNSDLDLWPFFQFLFGTGLFLFIVFVILFSHRPLTGENINNLMG